MQEKNITLLKSQEIILNKMKDFIYNSSNRVFVLKGYAGTGKTTLMKFLIQDLRKNNRDFSLLSSTGRAAKILSDYTNAEASTIHSMIYKYIDLNQDLSNIDTSTAKVDTTGQLYLIFEPQILSNDNRNSCVYIIDEASMVTDIEEKDVVQVKFGSGRILKELLQYDTLPDSKFIFIGDPCQLQPVQGTFSPALSPAYIEKTFGLSVQEEHLTEIMRQDNSIISAGAYIRKLWNKAPEMESFYPNKVWGEPLFLSKYNDVVIHTDLADMENDYINNVKEKGYTDSVFISSSNAKCAEASNKFRKDLGFAGVVQKGDLLMVVQNQNATGLMNGDMVEVLSVQPENERVVRNVQTPNGYHTELFFREITVKELFSEKAHTTLLLENTLTTTHANLDSRQQSGLFLDFILRMRRNGITQKKQRDEFDRMMRLDPYLNALRCSYGYAITCHKAQGGGWNSVYIQVPRNITLKPTKSKYQWLYTALTRAKSQVHICKDFFIR